MIELRKRDEFILTSISKMKNAIFGSGEVVYFFFFFLGVFFAIEILKACSINFLSCLSRIAFKEKSSKMSFCIAEEYVTWIPFKLKCKNKICKCTQGLQEGWDLKLSLPQFCHFIKQKS